MAWKPIVAGVDASPQAATAAAYAWRIAQALFAWSRSAFSGEGKSAERQAGFAAGSKELPAPQGWRVERMKKLNY